MYKPQTKVSEVDGNVVYKTRYLKNNNFIRQKWLQHINVMLKDKE